MTKKEMISQIEKVEKIASASKFNRMLMNPFKYTSAILFRELIYKKTKQEKKVLSRTFFNAKMHLLLPSSTDIYLTGGKSHNSEIRLAKFLIDQLENGDIFVDIGAHYGYFSLLASKLVGNSGKIYSFEASPKTYTILEENKMHCENIEIYNHAVSDERILLTFYEFPNLYSEYNSLDIEQFKNEDWFAEYKPNEIKIESIVLDDFLINNNIKPKIIKIDVEGAEFKVVNGLREHLFKYSPKIVVEFLSSKRGNTEHIKAEKLLKSLGYKPFIIKNNSKLQESESLYEHIENSGFESDNIVFMKDENAS